MTEYKVVFDDFKDKITDPDLLLFAENVQTDILISLLNKACSKFKRSCKIDLSNRDDILMQFNNDLGDEEISILSEVMIEYWLKPYLNNIDNLKNNLSTKDFSFFSPANLLSTIQKTYDTSYKRSRSEINSYSFLNSNFEELRP